MERIKILNHAWFLRVNGTEDTPVWLINTAIVIASGLIYLLPVLLAALWLWGGHVLRRLAVKCCLAALAALGINYVIGLFWTHPRPFMIGLGENWLYHSAVTSFPSNHMAIFAAVGFTLLFGGSRRLAVVVLATGVAVAWARIFLGVHFPLDMLGALGSAAVACGVVYLLWPGFGEPFMYLAERIYRVLLARLIKADWIRP